MSAKLKSNRSGSGYMNGDRQWFAMPKYPAGVIVCPLCHLPETTGVYRKECHCWDDRDENGMPMGAK